jgi:hypothetical protein
MTEIEEESAIPISGYLINFESLLLAQVVLRIPVFQILFKVLANFFSEVVV